MTTTTAIAADMEGTTTTGTGTITETLGMAIAVAPEATTTKAVIVTGGMLMAITTTEECTGTATTVECRITGGKIPRGIIPTMAATVCLAPITGTIETGGVAQGMVQAITEEDGILNKSYFHQDTHLCEYRNANQ